MTNSVLVELDRWGERGQIRPAQLDDGSQTVLGFRSNGNNKIVFDRSIFLGDFGFRVFVTEHRGETFLVRAAMAITIKPRRPRGKWSTTPLRERPLKPVPYASGEEAYWPLDRTGVFATYPEQWDDYWANNFIKETLDLLRSPEIPKHYELHGDNSDEMYYHE